MVHSMPRAVMIDGNSWWVTGGSKRTVPSNPRTFIRLDTTEIYTAGSGWSAGPDLPYPSSLHCFVKIDEDRYFMTGGYDRQKQVHK